MADRKDLDFTYSLIDRIFRLSLGELADFSGAKFDGDFSLTLEEAQRRKHAYIAEQIGIGPDRTMLDLGCGWGPMLDFARERGGRGTGVTLSTAQLESCRRHGLDAHLRDAREVDRDSFGPFDSVASLGAFEHFCSPADHEAGRQERIYGDLFANIAGILPPGGRLYLQTMVFGPNATDPIRGDVDGPAGLRRLLPGADGASVPRLLPAVRQGADRPHGLSPLPSSSRARAAGSTTSRRSRAGAGASPSRASGRPC